MVKNKRKINKKLILFTFLFTLINLVAKIWNIHEYSLYGDEPFSLFFAQQSISELFERIIRDKNPFLYFLILHGWLKLFGVSVINAKLLSVIFSSITGGLIFAFGYRQYNFKFGFIAAFLFLLSGIQFFYSHEIRAFSLVSLLSLISIFLFLNITQKPKKWHIAGLAFANVALILSHYAAFILPIIELIGIFILYKRNKNPMLYFIISQLIALIIFTPWFLFSVSNNLPEAGSFWLDPPNKIDAERLIINIAGKGLFLVSISVIL